MGIGMRTLKRWDADWILESTEARVSGRGDEARKSGCRSALLVEEEERAVSNGHGSARGRPISSVWRRASRSASALGVVRLFSRIS